MDGHDVGMPDAPEDLRLGSAVQRDLDRNEAVAQLRLGGEKNPRERPFAQLQLQVKIEKRFPGLGPADFRSIGEKIGTLLQEKLRLHQPSKGTSHRRELGAIDGRIKRLTLVTPSAEFLVGPI